MTFREAATKFSETLAKVEAHFNQMRGKCRASIKLPETGTMMSFERCGSDWRIKVGDKWLLDSPLTAKLEAVAGLPDLVKEIKKNQKSMVLELELATVQLKNFLEDLTHETLAEEPQNQGVQVSCATP